ncbi:MAG TPA: M28 family peptidase, partial [Phycicoccus sp.]|nr:M28 family peptidase [Phycicoccus sp.]
RKHVLSLPGFWITRSTGDRIRNELASGAIDSATLHLTVQRSAVTAQTVIGVLPGRTDDAIMVQSHHDSVGPGAVEDGTGASAVIALAEYYAAQAAVGARREKTLLFITFDSHFTGYHAHQDFVCRHVLADTPRWQVVLNATIEHIGLRAVRGQDGGFNVLQETEPRGIFENVSPRLKLALVKAIRRHGLGQTVLVNASPLEFGDLGIPTDASFTLTAGVPTISLVSGPLYLYDDADTIDKVDVHQLEPVARAFAEVIDAADRMPSGRLGLIPRRLRARLPRRGRAVDA